MYWVPPVVVIDPDHDEPPPRRRAADHLICLSIGQLDLNSICVAKRLFDLPNGDPALGMIRTEVSPVGGVPDDRPIVHPFSIYETDGQIGVASGI